MEVVVVVEKKVTNEDVSLETIRMQNKNNMIIEWKNIVSLSFLPVQEYFMIMVKKTEKT